MIMTFELAKSRAAFNEMQMKMGKPIDEDPMAKKQGAYNKKNEDRIPLRQDDYLKQNEDATANQMAMISDGNTSTMNMLNQMNNMMMQKMMKDMMRDMNRGSKSRHRGRDKKKVLPKPQLSEKDMKSLHNGSQAPVNEGF